MIFDLKIPLLHIDVCAPNNINISKTALKVFIRFNTLLKLFSK